METKERVFGIITDTIGVAQENLDESKKLGDDLGCDSLDAFEIVMAIEKEFNITVADDEYVKLKTVGDLINIVEQKL